MYVFLIKEGHFRKTKKGMSLSPNGNVISFSLILILEGALVIYWPFGQLLGV